MTKTLKGTGGFTPIEIVIVLAIVAILAGILTPTLTRYVGDSRIRNAEADVQAIAGAIGMFYGDTAHWPIWQSGNATKASDVDFDILVSSDGETPSAGDASAWTTSNLDNIGDQLVDNVPSHTTTAGDRRRWRGPYIEKVLADPWGKKYMVNVQYLQPGNVGGANPVFVFSAGPDMNVDTAFTQTGPSITVGGDDIVFRIK